MPIWLFCIQMSPKKWSKNTFGWARAEVLGALVNAVFLVALCFSITVEACKRYVVDYKTIFCSYYETVIYRDVYWFSRFIEVEEIHKPELIVAVGVLGLLVNVIGLFLFHGTWFYFIRWRTNFAFYLISSRIITHNRLRGAILWLDNSSIIILQCWN